MAHGRLYVGCVATYHAPFNRTCRFVMSAHLLTKDEIARNPMIHVAYAPGAQVMSLSLIGERSWWLTLYGGLGMSKLLRGLGAGWGASKLGGGCFSTVLIFVLLWWLLGNFDIFK